VSSIWNYTSTGVHVLHISVSVVSVLCSNRVSQMTKTYNDIEAVTRLLEEVSKTSNFRLFLACTEFRKMKNVDH
jgi:hypothetical protein